MPDFESHALRYKKSSPKRAAFSFSQITERGSTHGIRSRSGTEGQSGGLPRPRMTEPRSSRRESNPMLSAMKKALHSKCFFQCYPFLYGTDSISCLQQQIYHAVRQHGISCGVSRISYRTATYHLETRPKQSSPLRGRIFSGRNSLHRVTEKNFQYFLKRSLTKGLLFGIVYKSLRGKHAVSSRAAVFGEKWPGSSVG